MKSTTSHSKADQKHTNKDVINSIQSKVQQTQDNKTDNKMSKQAVDSSLVDPITGVLKLKKNKNKKTKEVSLTINHNNLKALV